MNYKNMPKIDLHCHLDGSLRPETVLELVGKVRRKKEIKNKIVLDSSNIKEELTAPKDCSSLVDYLKCFDLPIEVLQTKENLERVSFELLEDASKENIKYIEVRFAPQQHKEMGLTTDEIISSVIKGMRRAEEIYDIKGNYILSCMRHLSAESALQIIEDGKKFLGKGVVAVDLCGAEDEGFCHKFIEPMKKAREYGYKITIHAGETGIGGNVSDAINLLGANRIGHGIFISTEEKAYNLVKERNIALEICPTSNIQTKAVEGYNSHPIFDFYNDDIVVTLNTDNRTVSDTTMAKEYKETKEAFEMTLEQCHKIYMNSVEAAFISEEEKEVLRKKFVL